MRQWEKIASGGKYGFLSSSVFECVYQTWSPFKQVLNGKNSGAFHHEPPPPQYWKRPCCSPAGRDYRALQEYHPGVSPRNGLVGKTCVKSFTASSKS